MSLARALISEPSYVLLDDPTAGLDPVASNVIMTLIADIQKSTGMGVLIASHDLRRLIPLSDEIVCLFNGKASYQGSFNNLSDEMKYEKEFISCRYDI